MTIYAIKAYENMYGGLHGMYDTFVGEFDSLKDANETGVQMSYEVMESYGCIEEAIADLAESYEDDNEEMYEQVAAENVAYSVWKLLPDYNFTPNELDEMLSEDWEGTIESYFTCA